MLHDFRYAIRALVRRPLVTGVAILSLALGIGVNSAIFSLFDRLILRRLSVPPSLLESPRRTMRHATLWPVHKRSWTNNSKDNGLYPRAR